MITRETKTTLGVAIAVSTAMVGGALWVVAGLDRLKTSNTEQLVVLTRRVDDLTYELRTTQASMRDTWSKTNHENWALRLKILNPELNLKIPETDK